MKYLLGTLSVIIIVVVVGLYFNRLEHSFHDAELNNYKSRLGTIVVINKDTLVIIDYSQINESFTLSNGIKISRHLLSTKQ